MLGFGKKKDKKKDEDASSLMPELPGEDLQEKSKPEKESSQPPQDKPVKEKKAKFPKGLFKKKILIPILAILVIGGSLAGYFIFFTSDKSGPVYSETKLSHVNLPQEMLKFCFDFFPDLYQAFLGYDREMATFNAEIDRINAVGQKYPEQAKIVLREKKVWEKSQNTLIKSFLKVEKPVKEIFVLHQVNPEQGKAMIGERQEDLTKTAQDALEKAREQSRSLRKDQEPVPDKFFPGLIYKLKKIF